MKSLKMLLTITYFLLTTLACSETPLQEIDITSLTSDLGNQISMNGNWVTECEQDLGMNMTETFIFSENTLQIQIQVYSDESCNDQIDSRVIDVDFEVQGTFTAQLNGQEVTGNKISGTQKVGTQVESFKQSMHVVESETGLHFYHGRFGDDGGNLTSDGYPIEIIPIEFKKVRN